MKWGFFRTLLEIEERLTALAKRTGRTEAELAQELVSYGIEDLEDISIAEARLNDDPRGVG